MGVFKQGNYGEFSGKTGNMIVYFWQGKRVVRSRPSSVFNPNTEQQQQHRGRFGLVSGFVKAHKSLIKTGFKPWASGMTAFNAAMSYNLANAIKGEVPKLCIDFEKAGISRGDLPVVENLRASATLPGTLLLEWTGKSTLAAAHPNDKLMVSVYHETDNVSQTYDAVAVRSTGKAVLKTPTEWSGKTVQVLAFLIGTMAYGAIETESQVSNTVWAGAVQLI